MRAKLTELVAKEGGFPVYMTQVRNEVLPRAKLSLRPGVKIERSATQPKARTTARGFNMLCHASQMENYGNVI